MPCMDVSTPRRSGSRYWLVVLILTVLGFLTIFSLGLYFWYLAVALTLLAPFRSRPKVFLPGLALFLGFLFAYVLTAPWGCSQSFVSTTSGEELTSPVVCTSLVGIEYSGSEPFEPSRTPALIAGVVTGLVAAGVTWAVVRSQGHRQPARVTMT